MMEEAEKSSQKLENEYSEVLQERNELDKADDMTLCDEELPPPTFEVLKLRSLDEVMERIQQYQEETMTHFIKYNKDKHFGNEDYVPNIANGRIHYWSHLGKIGVPIAYDGVPFMHVGRQVFVCHQGHDNNRQQKNVYKVKKLIENQNGSSSAGCRNRGPTKKVNCPAEIYVSHVMKFPRYKSPAGLMRRNQLPSDHMRRQTKQRIIADFSDNPNKFQRKSWYYVRLPDISEHEGHPVVKKELGLSEEPEIELELGDNGVVSDGQKKGRGIKRKSKIMEDKLRTKEPVDPRILKKMHQTIRRGNTKVSEVREVLTKYIREEIFPGVEPPPEMYRMFNPTTADIRNAVQKVKQDMRLEGKSFVQERCVSLLEEISGVVLQTKNELCLAQLEVQLRTVFNALQNQLTTTQFVSHRPQDSISEDTTQQLACHNCNKVGHVLQECPLFQMCDYCARKGHLFDDCPARLKMEKSAKISMENITPSTSSMPAVTSVTSVDALPAPVDSLTPLTPICSLPAPYPPAPATVVPLGIIPLCDFCKKNGHTTNDCLLRANQLRQERMLNSVATQMGQNALLLQNLIQAHPPQPLPAHQPSPPGLYQNQPQAISHLQPQLQSPPFSHNQHSQLQQVDISHRTPNSNLQNQPSQNHWPFRPYQ